MNENQLKLIVRSAKRTYKPGQPISIDVFIINESEQELRLDYRIIFNKHVRVWFVDEYGSSIGKNGVMLVIAPPQGADDFVKLLPGQLIGAVNMTRDTVRLDQPGRYSLYASYSDVGMSIYGKDFGVSAWRGEIESQPITVLVR